MTVGELRKFLAEKKDEQVVLITADIQQVEYKLNVVDLPEASPEVKPDEGAAPAPAAEPVAA